MTSETTRPRTLAEKVWDEHVVVRGEGEGSSRTPDLLYIDLHLVHEVTSPQASRACAWPAAPCAART